MQAGEILVASLAALTGTLVIRLGLLEGSQRSESRPFTLLLLGCCLGCNTGTWLMAWLTLWPSLAFIVRTVLACVIWSITSVMMVYYPFRILSALQRDRLDRAGRYHERPRRP